jgi:cyanuric acid amidohydrolase
VTVRPGFVTRLATAHPGDTSAFAGAGVAPSEVVAVVGKTEGNGCVNDFTRMLAASAWGGTVGPQAVTVMSGGTEGVLSPHVSLVVAGDDGAAAGPGRCLVVGSTATVPIAPVDLGRSAQTDAVAAAVTALLAGIPPDDVHLVLVKCPLLTSDQIEQHRDAVITTETYESMAASRAASAAGVVAALGEPGPWSAVASASAGYELDCCSIVALAMAEGGHARQRIAHTVMADALDAGPVIDLLAQVRGAGGRVVQVFAKAEADPSGSVRGRRHTMLTDSDVHSTRHARAAVGGLLAGLTGEPAIYVSGGAENQGPPGGGGVTVVWEAP